MNVKSAVKHIDKNGLLLVFPINNKPEPRSLWSEFFPRSKMRWEWDTGGDDRVARLWSLMKRLSDGREVVYSKWYQGRATFFSRPVFTACLRLQIEKGDLRRGLSRAAAELLDVLESDSPLSTKQLKRLTDLQGRDNEPVYARAMKELFTRQLIVAFGEVDDGAFPSLAVGATANLYEDLWQAAHGMDPDEARAIVDRALPEGAATRKFLNRVLSGSTGARAGALSR